MTENMKTCLMKNEFKLGVKPEQIMGLFGH